MNEQNYTVVLTDAQEVKLLECDEPDSEIFQIARDVIGCEWIEIVEIKSRGNDQHVLLIDEEGKLKPGMALINCIASHLYESEKHGDPIVGTAMIAKKDGEDLHLLTETEARDLAGRMLFIREASIERMAKAFSLQPRVRKKTEISSPEKISEKASQDHRQPCSKKEMER